MSELIRLDRICKHYSTTNVLKDICLTFEETGMVFIKGKSGCGKTTLLNLLGGLDTPSDGQLFFENKCTNDFGQSDWDEYRNCKVGFIFQDYNLLDQINVKENIELALDIQNELLDAKGKQKRIEETLRFVGLEGFENRKINEMSGGQKQRVAIARAIAKQCSVILADEPTGNLDSENSKTILDLLRRVSRTKLVIIVTHDVEAAYKYGNRIIGISDGVIIEDKKLQDKESLESNYSITLEDDKRVLCEIEGKLEIVKERLAAWISGQAESAKYTLNINIDEGEKNDVEIQRNTNISKKNKH